jgi:hypothetical protein
VQSFSLFVATGPPFPDVPEHVVREVATLLDAEEEPWVKAYINRVRAAEAAAALRRAPTDSPTPKGELLLTLVSEDWPDVLVEDVSLSIGDFSLYERIGLSRDNGDLARTKRIVLFRGAMHAGTLPFRLQARLTSSTRSGDWVDLACEPITVPEREEVCWEILAKAAGTTVRGRRTDRTEPRVHCVLAQQLVDWGHIVGLQARIDDLLVFDWIDRHGLGRADARIKGIDRSAREISLYDGPTLPGDHRVSVRAMFAVTGEVDPRELRFETGFVAMPGSTVDARVELPLPDRTPRPEQLAKVARIDALKKSILDRLRAGGAFRNSDQDANWAEYTVKGSAFTKRCGSHLDPASEQTTHFATEEKLIDSLLEAVGYPYYRDVEESLGRILRGIG